MFDSHVTCRSRLSLTFGIKESETVARVSTRAGGSGVCLVDVASDERHIRCSSECVPLVKLTAFRAQAMDVSWRGLFAN